MPLQRLYNFQAGTKINSGQVNAELNQLVNKANELETSDSNKVPYSGATNDVDLNGKLLKNVQSINFQDIANDGVFWKPIEGNLSGRNGNYEIRSYLNDGTLKTAALSITTEGIISFLAQSFVYGTLSGAPSISTGVSTKIPLTESVDTQSELASNTFTAKTDGIYLIEFYCDWGAVVSGDSFLRLYKNGVYWGVIDTRTGARWLTGSTLIILSANDTLEFHVMQSSGVTKNVSAARVHIAKIQ